MASQGELRCPELLYLPTAWILDLEEGVLCRQAPGVLALMVPEKLYLGA